MSEKLSPLERYLLALEAVAGANVAGITLRDLAARCDLPVGSAHRVIHTLLDSGLITRRSENSKEYVLASRLFRIVQTATDSSTVGSAIQGTLDQLAQALGETCFVARLVDNQIRSVAWAAPETGLRNNVYPGDVLPPNAAASAKAILAHQDEAEARRVLGVPVQLTAQSHTSWETIAAEYAMIREEGVATCWDEMDLGLSAIAVPVCITPGPVTFSLGLTGLTPRMRQVDLAAATAQLTASAETLGTIIAAVAHGQGGPAEGGPQRRRTRQATETSIL